jgi:hypothetical protein
MSDEERFWIALLAMGTVLLLMVVMALVSEQRNSRRNLMARQKENEIQLPLWVDDALEQMPEDDEKP